MSADSIPGHRPDNDDDNGPDAEVFDFDTWTRAGRPGNAPASEPEPDGNDDTPDTPDDDDDGTDHESILVGQIVPGPAVDPADEPRPFRHRGDPACAFVQHRLTGQK